MFGEIAQQVRNRLAVIAGVAEFGDDEAAANLSRSEVPHLVATVEVLLDAHHPDENGYCRTCWGRRWWFKDHPQAPCHVVRTARTVLFDLERL